MPLVSLCLLAGAYALEGFPRLPDDAVLVCLGVTALGLTASKRLRAPACVVLGMSVMGIAASHQLDERLDPALQSVAISAVVTIREFPVSRNQQTSLVVSPAPGAGLPSRIRLSWLEPDVIPQLGESWRLEVRLRRPGGYANPGGFDYEAWLLRSRVGATGYVVRDGHNYRVYGSPNTLIALFRQRVVDRLSRILPQDEATAVLMAIIVGARHEITRAQWDSYAATGTSHLMAISGLHIGLAAGAVFLLFWGVSAAIPGRRNCRDRALVAAVLAAVAYAAMSGFAVPARRACVMVFIAAFASLRRREVPASVLLAITAAMVFLADPLTALTPGFKLSFAAVAILFVIANRHLVISLKEPLVKPCTGMLRLGQVQIGLLAGLLPLTVILFERFSAIAPLVNILVLPVFNAVTVPFSIAGALLDGPLSPLGDQLLGVAHKSVRLVLATVSQAEKNDWLSFETPVPVSRFVLLLPFLQILLPTGWPGRRLVLLAVLAIVVARPKPLPPDCFNYHVLDVGQGLAVVIQTREHALLFDTGPAFQSGNNTAELVVNPFLRNRGIDRLDVVVVSHSDLDHSGGIHSMIGATNVGGVLTGEHLPSLGHAQQPCVAGQRWQWDGVDFRMLHPGIATPWKRNNASCVLQVAVGNYRLLLTGDIEAPVERLLQYRQQLHRSHVVVVPHHGSGTSSSAALVDPTAPAIAIVSAGRMNRWGFPREDVVSRWQGAGATIVDTGQAGAVSQQLCRQRSPGPLETARSTYRRYWHDAPPDRS